jgi:DNA polymerase-4
LKFIGPSTIEDFMERLPVEKFFGVGKVTAQKMKQMGLHTGADLKKLTEDELIRHFGKAGKFYYQIVRGIDNREVQPHRETKSLGAEDTFAYDLTTLEEMEAELDKIAITVHNRLLKYELKGRTLTLKVKYSDFKQITRNQSFPTAFNDLETICKTAKQLIAATNTEDARIRLLGISLSNFGDIVPKQKEEREVGPGDQLALEF